MNLYRKDQVQRNLNSETIKHQKLSQRKVETAKPSTGKESVVQIKVSGEPSKESVGENRESGSLDAQQYEEYLTSSKGPKRIIDYSKAELTAFDD